MSWRRAGSARKNGSNTCPSSSGANAGPLIVDDRRAPCPFSPFDADLGAHAVRGGVDHQVAQRAIEREPARAHGDGLGGRIGHVEILLLELAGDARSPARRAGSAPAAPCRIPRAPAGWRCRRCARARRDRASQRARSSSSSTNSARSRMRVIGVRRSWPAAATRRMRLSIAARSRVESEFSARAVARTSAGPRSGRCGSMPSGPTEATALSSRTSGLHHAVGNEDGDRRGAEGDQREPSQQAPPRGRLRRQIGDRHQQPALRRRPGSRRRAGLRGPSRETVTG